jgi:hypothetical protein
MQHTNPAAFAKLLEAAMWAGDTDLLYEIAPCLCCCHEHTFGLGCPAYQWGGCRGQGSAEDPASAENLPSWLAHYKKFHGMTEDEFFGGES